MSSTRNSARLLLIAALSSAPAWAALPDEIQVYTDELEAAGERGLELHVNTTPSGRSTPDYPGEVTPRHGLRITPEISWGLGHDMDWGLYLPFVRSAEGSDYFAGPRFRLKWIPVRAERGYFAGVNAELSFVQRRFEEARRTLEIRPILGWRGAPWLISFNPTLGTDLAGADRGVWSFHPSLKLARDVGARTALGIEYYADASEHTRTLFAVVDAERALGIHFGIGRGLTAATDRWTVKAILSF